MSNVFWDEKFHSYAPEFKEQMLNGYTDREKYEKLIKNLDKLQSDKLVTEENYVKLKNEYSEKLRKAKRHIASTKSKITARIKQCTKQVNEINDETETINARFTIGEYSKEAFNESMRGLEQQKQLFESAITELRIVHKINSTQAPSPEKPPPAEQMPPISEESPHVQEPVIINEESVIQTPPIVDKASEATTSPISQKYTTEIKTKKRGWRSVLLIVLIGIAAIDLVIWGLILAVGPKKPLSIGDQAPNFTLPDINGRLVSLQDFHGKQVVLYIWWQCPPCKQDLPYIQDLNNGSDERMIRVLTINTLDSKNGIIDFVSRSGYSFPVLLDTNNSVTAQYMLRGVPQTIVINRDGKIQNMKAGAFQNQDEFRKLATGGLSQFDKAPPQISEVNLSATYVLSWRTDKKTQSSLQGVQVDGNVTSWDITENWTVYHTVNIANMSSYDYDKIKIVSRDYLGNNALATITPPKPTPSNDLSTTVIVNEDGTLYQEEKLIKIDFVNGGTKKYVCYGRISNTTHNIVTVGWSIHLVSCPIGGEHSVFAATDEVAIDGYLGQIVKIPISIDGNAPSGPYQFKIVFYGL
jgi:peroxiredoxin/predicted DNA binding CopG/RHH family protein